MSSPIKCVILDFQLIFVIENMKFEWQCSQYLDLIPTCELLGMYIKCDVVEMTRYFPLVFIERHSCPNQLTLLSLSPSNHV